jgi:hypothetical protein
MCSNAEVAGSNVVFEYISHIDYAYYICENCTFAIPSNTTGYQDANGFATCKS